MLIAAGVAANVSSCRNFALDDRGAGGAGSSAGTWRGESGGEAGSPADGSNGGSGGVAGGAGGNGEPAGDGGAHAAGTANHGGADGSSEEVRLVSPAALNGLSLWLESSASTIEANNSRVSKWKDSSANGNDATEPNPAFRPFLAEGTLNGWATVEFDGEPSNLTVSDRTTLQFGAEPFTVAFVAEFHNPEAPEFTEENNLVTFTYVGYGEILTKVASDDPYDGIAIFANYPAPYNMGQAQRRLGAQLEMGTAGLVSTSTNLNDGNFRLFVVQRSAPDLLEQRINGTPQGRLEIPADIDVSAPGRSLRLGGNAVVPLLGSFAELVMVKGPLTDANLHGLERYLMEKFAL